jgi:D-sedoheptulose 7-phosphate isomerase
MTFVEDFLACSKLVIEDIDPERIDQVAEVILSVREGGGRLFVIGSGGGAGHSSHAVCDFRKLCNIEAYAPYDNVSELTARVNDEGWETTLSNWLKISRLSERDGLFVFSVGGGSLSKEVSMNLVNAMKLAKEVKAKIVGVVGKDGGYTAEVADAFVLIANPKAELVTPITEGFQAVIWHLLVSHPKLQVSAAKWESLTTTKAR